MSIICRDAAYLREQAKKNIKTYLDEQLSGEYAKCLVGLTALEDVEVSGNPTQQIRLLKKFDWLYSDEFLKLKDDYSPIDTSKYDISECGGNDDKDIEKTRLFWKMFEELEAEEESKQVRLTRLQEFILNQSWGRICRSN